MAAIAIPTIIAGYAVPGFLHNALVGDRYAADAGLMQLYLVGTALLTTSLFLTYILIAAGWNWIWSGLVPIAAAQAGRIFTGPNLQWISRACFWGAGWSWQRFWRSPRWCYSDRFTFASCV